MVNFAFFCTFAKKLLFLIKMRFLRYLILLCITVIGGIVSAQSQRELGQLMRERNEYYFILSVDKPDEIHAINDLCSVDGTDGRTVVCYANQQQYESLLQSGYQPVLQTPPSMREEARMWDGNRATYEWDSYLSYTQYVSMMEGFPNSVSNGANCTLLDLGTLSTPNHRRILGVRLNNGQPDGKPKFLYTSTMHGDEVTGMILMLRLIDEFCTSSDSRILNILDNVDLFIFPCTNPDGTYYGGNGSVNNAKRYNGNGVDLNRHFPDFDKGAHPDGASYYQDEARWMMDLAQEYLFTMGANYHGGAEVMNYPWDTYQPVHPDDAWWQHVSREYANLAQSVNSNYMTDQNNGITNGYAWYTISGSRQDYMNYYAQCREVTIECSTQKKPNASQLPNFWNYNHNAMLTYIEECLNGVHGFVYDAENGEPIEGVTVTVQDHDHHGSAVSTHAIGDFHRPIKGGSYTFAFEKEGYCPQFIDVTVADGQRVELNNIQLTPGSCMVPNFTASVTDVSLGQSINFTDASYGTIASWNWIFEGTTPSASTAQNPTGITYNTIGDYDVTLIITDAEGNSDTLTKSNYIHVTESIIMQNATVTTCYGLFYDSGGPNNNYGNDLEYTLTFNPSTNGAKVSVSFTEFHLESNYDYLYIYDGNSTSATQIGHYSGTTSPGTVTATNATGALTFRFISDYSVNYVGWVATVSCVYPERIITATAEPTEGGTVTGAGTYTQFETCTLTATANEGYVFVNWTENGEEVSTDANYSFEVTADRVLVANFEENAVVYQTITLNVGWNWWSTYIELSDVDGLSMLEAGMEENGLFIKSNDAFEEYSSETGEWMGTLQSIDNESGYKIRVSEACTWVMSGPMAVSENHPITLSLGWNWIGYPVSTAQDITSAMSGFEPEAGDVLKGQNGYTIYDGNLGWTPSTFVLNPGESYMYYSNATEEKTLIFTQGE